MASSNLKQEFTSGPVRIHVHLEKPFNMEADASGFALWSVLSQLGADENLHPIAFY